MQNTFAVNVEMSMQKSSLLIKKDVKFLISFIYKKAIFIYANKAFHLFYRQKNKRFCLEQVEGELCVDLSYIEPYSDCAE